MCTLEQTDWLEIDEDPDPWADLGYETVDLDLIPTSANGRNSVLVLPTDEEELKGDAFMVVNENAVCDLATKI